jgi:uncharacterized protein (UPF0303 family)
LEELLQEENELQFDSFSNETELRIGMEIIDRANSFPIRVRGAGVISSVVVSGLPGDQDNKLVTAVLRQVIDVSAE